MKWLASSTGQATFEDIKNTSLGKLVRDQLLSGILSGDMAERIGSAGVAAVADLAEEKAWGGRFGLSG